jgi:hypothetical protein
MKTLIKQLMILLFFCLLLSSIPIPENINVWYKISSAPDNPGELLALDMSSGYSFCDGNTIYIVVNYKDTGEEVVVILPNGGNFWSPQADTFLIYLQKEMEDLEEYLRKSK